MTFSIPEAQLPDLKHYLALGSTKVDVRPPSGADQSTAGHITFIDNTVDPTTGTIKVKASFENTDWRLWPGQFLNVTVTFTTESNAVVVPNAAVQTGQQGFYVFVVTPEQKVELRSRSRSRGRRRRRHDPQERC